MNKSYSTIRRVSITAPMAERHQVIDWLDKNNYHIRRSGPKYVGKGRVTLDIFHAIGEKKI